MIKYILTGLVAFLCVATSVNAGLLSSVATSNWEGKVPTAKYKLSTYGFDVRIYEWIPKDNPNVRCIFVAGNENSSGVSCYPVEDKK